MTGPSRYWYNEGRYDRECAGWDADKCIASRAAFCYPDMPQHYNIPGVKWPEHYDEDVPDEALEKFGMNPHPLQEQLLPPAARGHWMPCGPSSQRTAARSWEKAIRIYGHVMDRMPPIPKGQMWGAAGGIEPSAPKQSRWTRLRYWLADRLRALAFRVSPDEYDE